MNRTVAFVFAVLAFAVFAGCDRAEEPAAPDAAAPETEAPDTEAPEAGEDVSAEDVTPQGDLEKAEAEIRDLAGSLDKAGLDSVIMKYKAYIQEKEAEIQKLGAQGLAGGQQILDKVTALRKELETIVANLGIYEEARAAK